METLTISVLLENMVTNNQFVAIHRLYQIIKDFQPLTDIEKEQKQTSLDLITEALELNMYNL